jgi:hypothetical protein
MLHRIETTDPITRHDIDDLYGKPYVVETGRESDLTVYFESEETRRQYLEMPVGHSVHASDNPTDEGIDEG